MGRRRQTRFHGVSRTGHGRDGECLSVAQFGGKHPSAKPWKGQGAGVFEIVEDFDADTYRAVYAVRFREMVYVLPKGIKTARGDIELVERRLKIAQKDYKARYGKEK